MMEDTISNEEFLTILRDLDSKHAVFYQLWALGKPIFIDENYPIPIPTAAVMFNQEGECVNFIFNHEFWKSLTHTQKLFVICHECFHVILNHGARFFNGKMDEQEQIIRNVSTDLAINHNLLNKFGFIKEEIDPPTEKEPKGKYCWLEKIFEEKENIPDDKSSEFYYNRIKEKIEKQEGEGQGDCDGAQGKGNPLDGSFTVDEHMSAEDFSDVIDQLNDLLTDEEKEQLRDFIEKNYDKETASKLAGKEAGGKWTFADTKKRIKKKKKWETVIKKWAMQYIKQADNMITQWARKDRRLNMLPDDMFLPSDMEVEERTTDEQRIQVWFFQDTSGSCSGYTQRFFDAARSLPEERFDVRMHCFDTRVYETTLESGKLYGFGGTSFHIIEDYIQQAMKKNEEKYPKAVFVITDGYGDNVKPEKPENWYWFLTPSGSTGCIPKTSHNFNLKDYE